jgi:cell shape-determining protein MreC
VSVFVKITLIILGVAAAVLTVIVLRFHPLPRTWVADFMHPFMPPAESAEPEVQETEESLFQMSKVDLIERIRELEDQRATESVQLEQLAELEKENGELRALNYLPLRARHHVVLAGVVGRDPANGGRRLRIGVGSDSKIAVGQPVLARGVLLGRIGEVSRHSAVVITLLDPNCRVSVRVAGTNMYGILRGAPEQWLSAPTCELSYLPRDREFAARTEIETSNLGAQIPPGIGIGDIVPGANNSVGRTHHNLYTIVDVRPYFAAIDFHMVMVLVPE